VVLAICGRIFCRLPEAADSCHRVPSGTTTELLSRLRFVTSSSTATNYRALHFHVALTIRKSIQRGNFMRSIHVLLASASLTLSAPAFPHTHVDSDGRTVTWYPPECCNNHDCRPVAAVRRANQGLWMTTVDGSTVLIGADQERRPSRDMRWHICLSEDIHHNTVVQCVFEPPSANRYRNRHKVAG